MKQTVATIIAEEEFVGIARESIAFHRRELESIIAHDPFFQLTLDPYPDNVNVDSPEVVRRMIAASVQFGVGPMSAVAGTIAELAVEEMVHEGATHAIVDNGGDIALVNETAVSVGINTWSSKEFALEMAPSQRIKGVCTSSGKIGCSISFGDADAVTVISSSAALADAAATAICNRTREEDIQNAIGNMNMEGIEGVLIFHDDYVGTWGKIPKIINISPKI